MTEHKATWDEVSTPDGEYLDEIGLARRFFAYCPSCGWSADYNSDESAKSAAAAHTAKAYAERTSLLMREDSRF